MSNRPRGSRLLLEEPSLQVQPSLAVAIGLNEAIALQQLNFWLTGKAERKDDDAFIDGRWWVYNSIREWREKSFPFWSEDTIQRTFKKLEKLGLVIKGHYASNPYDRRVWYTIDYAVMDSLNLQTSITADSEDALTQLAAMDKRNLRQSDNRKMRQSNTKIKDSTKTPDQEFAASAAPPLPPAIVPPADPPSKPARARRETPEQSAWFNALVPVVARVCCLDLNVAGAYAQCKKALQAIEHAKTPPTEALLVELFEAPTGYWFSNFPGNRDGLPPKPHQIPNEWARALAWRPVPYANGNGHQARAAPTKQERTLAALDEYLAEQGYEPPPVVPGVIEGRVIRGNTS